MFKLVSLIYLLIELIWKLALLPMMFVLLSLIGTITCFLEDLFVDILILDFIKLDLLMILFMSAIFLEDVVRNISLI